MSALLMSLVSLRLLPFAVADGPSNMAVDEALLHSAVEGLATLRFYGWSAPTVSLGYFQQARVRLTDPMLADLPWVRRPSGGATLVHHHEVTYALALPADVASGGTVWLRRMHTIIQDALTRLGVPTTMHETCCEGKGDSILCFRQVTPGDLTFKGAKVLGSAQRRHRGATLQHGAVLLRQSRHTPLLPGIEELTGIRLDVEEVCATVRQELQRQTGWTVGEGALTIAEQDALTSLCEKYAGEAWNRKR
jgi:lipoate-protein ligase A